MRKFIAAIVIVIAVHSLASCSASHDADSPSVSVHRIACASEDSCAADYWRGAWHFTSADGSVRVTVPAPYEDTYSLDYHDAAFWLTPDAS